uniref:mitogen-activated protein kinase kinase n=2 Tax=Guillardia theta TaxID=55529 RepID=A0A6U6DI80_GUITH|mmetsp:Transcript_6321/g.22537  ORF Transcript_6321/g.22537 Transcript_6321/m.22537 type:complete len:397 (+) Transcript_6321:545-1735(+)
MGNCFSQAPEASHDPVPIGGSKVQQADVKSQRVLPIEVEVHKEDIKEKDVVEVQTVSQAISQVERGSNRVSDEQRTGEDSDEFVDAYDDIRHFERSETPEAPQPPVVNGEPQEAERKRILEVNPMLLEKHDRVGKGSSGSVYKALHVETGRIVALKCVPLTLKAGDREEVVVKLRELYSSDHPNVCQFHGAEYDAERSTILIAMEYMDLRSLKDITKSCGKIPEKVMGNCASQILEALTYLHTTRRIIHRDVKPSNVLVNSRGSFKLGDFGMSKELSNTLSAGQTWVGTSSYMSPERVSGLDYSYNADVWGLGILVYESCSGQPAYAGSTFELLDEIVDGEPPALTAEAFSEEAVNFVRVCLEKDHKKRPDCPLLSSQPFILLHAKYNITEWLASL